MEQIENIEIRFSGSANFKQVMAETAKLNAQLRAMQAEIAKIDDKKMRDVRSAFNQRLANSNGSFVTEAVRAKSATTLFTEALVKQDVTLSHSIKNRKLFNEVLREQYLLQKMTAVQWSKSASGRVSADVIVPRGVSDDVARLSNSWKANTAEMLKSRFEMAAHAKGSASATEATRRFTVASDVMRIRLGMTADVLSSVTSNMVKWGKNTQWAGRQLMVGFTVPFAAFAAVAGMAAYNVDKEMTRILKVYDYSAEAMGDNALREAESNKIRAMSLENAKQAAKDYGVAVKDTLEMEAELAATGMTGNELIQRTTLLNKAMILGELDKQQAIKASTALQTAYGHNTEKMAEDFAYMSAIANATSLSMSDFVEGLPRGAAILKNVGVGLQDMGVLMAALKQSGIAAGEGMNGLRSGAQKLLTVTPAAEKLWAKLLPDTQKIQEIVAAHNGQFIPSLQAIGNEMRDLEVYERQQVITKIFGIHQSNKMFMVMDSLINKTNQVGKAMEVASMSADQWATMQANALATVQNSASNKIARAIESIKSEMVDLGAAFLPMAAGIMQFVGGLLKMFNGLDEGKKKFILITAALAAGFSIFTMLLGLTSNLIGTLGGFAVALVKTRMHFSTMTLEQKAQAIMAQKSASIWRDQGLAAQTLSTQLRGLVGTLDDLALRQERAALNGLTGGGQLRQFDRTTRGFKPGDIVVEDRVNTPMGPMSRTRHASPEEIRRTRDLAHTEALAENEQRIAAASGTTKRNWNAIAASTAGVGLTATMLVSTMGHAAGASGEVLNNVTNTLLVASLLGPALIKALTATKVTAALANIRTAFIAGRMGPHMAGRSPLLAGLRAALPVAGNLVKVLGPAGLIVGGLISAGLAVKGIRDGMEEARQTQVRLTESAKDWAKVLGFTYTNAANAANVKKSEEERATSLAKKFREANKEAAKGLDIAAKSKDKEDLINAAINEGVKARMHGATAGQARLATQTALAVAGKTEAEITELMLQVDAKINFGNMEEVAKAQGESFGKTFSDAVSGKIQSEKWITRVWENGSKNLTSGAKEAAKQAGKEFWNAFDSKEGSQEKKRYFEGIEKDFSKQTSGLMQNLRSNSAMGMAGLLGDWDSLADMAANDRNAGKNDLTPFRIMFTTEQQESIKKAAEYEREFVRAMAAERGLAPEKIKNLNTMKDLHKELGIALYTTSDATVAYNTEVAASERGGKKLSEAEKLHILNKWRLAAGLEYATDTAQGFGEALQGSSGAVDQFGAAIDSSIMSAEEWGSAWTEATKKTFDGAQNMALDEAERQRAEAQEQALENISAGYEKKEAELEARAERKNKSFDNRAKALEAKHDRESDALTDRQKARQKAVADSYDNRIKKIQDAIDAEERAEEIRQRLFEAEKTRLERLAAMQNANIDFNVALNTGNLDEAAKLFNNMQSQQDSWALEDATAGSGDAADARNKARQGQIDNIDKAKDAALEALQKKEDAEKDALKAKQDRERDALEAEKSRYAKSLEAQKKALSDGEAYDKKVKEDELRRRKQTLELELLAIRASTPRNKAEYDAQIKAIEGAYNRYGINLRSKGNTWAGDIGRFLEANIASAAASLRDDINWKDHAAKITADFTQGAFNMDISEFASWIRTGKAPNDAFKPYKSGTAQGRAHNEGHKAVKSAHTGGFLGGQNLSQKNRKGVPMSADLYPSEVSLIAKKGEYVMNEKVVRQYGVGVMDEINAGNLPIGGANLGLPGIIGGGLFASLKNMMQMGVMTAAMRTLESQGTVSATTGKAGAYGNIKLDSSQLKNAATILSTGKSLGASKRDLTIALMTAMQESTLRNINYGDRDSLGLFQQRPSQGWGAPEQILDPVYASTKFFKELFKVKDRNNMPLTLAAQAVQRSAFPYAYAKWEGMANAIVNGTTFAGGEMGLEAMLKALPTVAGGGKGGKPMTAGTYRVSSEYGMRTNPVTGEYKLHNGIDLAAPGGTPIYAVNSGKVLSAGYAGGYGNYVVIAHPDGTQTGYAHQSRLNVKAGQQVTKGQHIGAVGTTGNSTGNHLHFQMGRAGDWQNPRNFIPGLAKGGYTLNDGYAMLHKSETVLTADLSDKLRTGLNNLANGANNQYTITVDMRGAVLRDEFDVKSAVKGAVKEVMNEQASKMGRSRKVNA